MQCKDIPDGPILQFLARCPGEWHSWYFRDGKDVRTAMPGGFSLDDRLVLAKMRGLIRRGLVAGCPCGCRGDYEITDKGLAEITEAEAPDET